ncbi:MAG: hypothetical protein K9M45_07960 [Kiritimatiellales bacterium]|nr:hypothetical protein [Kiritimatiellales bacterium]
MNKLSMEQLNQALGLLGADLEDKGFGPYHLVVCGGAALIACRLVARTTAYVDVVALVNEHSELVCPDPLPPEILQAAEFVQKSLMLPEDWLNNGPSRDPGGLFQVGLPLGISNRLKRQDFGSNLTVHFLGRYDQIHLKLFAAVDSGPGRHVADLLELKPTETELEAAARWALTHDPSQGFRIMLISMLRTLEFKNVADRI